MRVWLIDQAGHADPAGAATLALTYGPPVIETPPGPPTSTTPAPPPAITNPLPPPPHTTPMGEAKLKITTLQRKGRTVTVVLLKPTVCGLPAPFVVVTPNVAAVEPKLCSVMVFAWLKSLAGPSAGNHVHPLAPAARTDAAPASAPLFDVGTLLRQYRMH